MMLKQFLTLFLAVVLMFSLAACTSRQQAALLEDGDSLTADVLSTMSDPAIHSETAVSSETETIESVSEAEPVSDTASSTVSEAVGQISSVEETASQPVISEPEETVAEEPITVESLTASLPTVSRTEIGQRFVDQTKRSIQAMEENGDGVLAQENKVHVQKAAEKGKLLIPYSTRSDLEISRAMLPTINMKTGGAHWSFYADVSEILLENEYYKVYVIPLTAEEMEEDLRDYFYPDETDKKLGTYNGMEYAYFDGYEGEDRMSSVDTAAWFIQDGFLIRITVLYVNNYKPWNNEWFDYFEYETVIL